ncbi:MAG: type I phosphomannose isomerase catalytic subunit [Candidatus Izemoplasmatales bacterium]
MAKDDTLYFQPIFKERIWGGRKLSAIYPDTVPDGPIGEAWIISAVPGSESVVAEGPHAGRTLAELYRTDRTLFPRAGAAFPLLTKILDARDRLSVQVHPDDEYARRHENQSGKTECWYVLEADPGATLVLGHDATTREELRDAVLSGTLESLLRTVPVRRGDFVHIPAGTLHAIGGGIVLLENQQSSDVTYRVYDYGRLDASGRPRALHVESSLAVVAVPAEPVPVVNFADTFDIVTMVEADAFTVRKLAVRGSFHFVNRRRRWYAATVVAGTASFNGRPIRFGDAFVIPSSVGLIDVVGECEIVVAFLPAEDDV